MFLLFLHLTFVKVKVATMLTKYYSFNFNVSSSKLPTKCFLNYTAKWAKFFIFCWGCILLVTLANAQVTPHATWPNKPIRWVIPYTPGGITDNATRLVLQKVQIDTGWNFVIENKPGANSILGADTVARAAPDGYTFLTVIGAHAVNATLYAGRLPYDPVKSFIPISTVGISPLIMTANINLPVSNVRELINYAKANPGKVSFASSGVGSASHLTFELFKQLSGIDIVHVPYKGTTPALADLMGGSVQIMSDTPSALMPFVKSGKIKALAMYSLKHVKGAESVPTIVEAGGPPLEGSTWVLFLGPKGVPKDIINKLSAEISKAVRSSEISSKFDELSIDPVGNSPAEAEKFLDDEIVKWAKVISAAGVKAEQ
jgi:tripartite-type tricarboxylate transporter receptor subunit TctC